MSQPLPTPFRKESGGYVAFACFVTLFLLAGTCAIALCCELSGCLRAAQAERPLRAEPLLPKLTVTPPVPVPAPEVLIPVPEPPTSEPAPIREETISAPSLPPVVETMTPRREQEAPAPALLIPAPPMMLTAEPPLAPPAPADVCLDPVVYSHRCESQPVESPMLRNWTTLALCSALAVLPAAPAPLLAQNVASKDLEKINERLDRLEARDATHSDVLDKIQRALAQINTSHQELVGRLKSVEERKAPEVAGGTGNSQKIEGMLNQIIELQKTMDSDVQGVRKDMAALKKDVTALQGDQAATKLRLDALELQLTRLSDEFKTIQKRLELANGTTTVVGSPPVSSAALERALDDIRNKLGAIEQAILRLQPSASRSAYYGPATATPAAAATGSTGRVLLENFYPEDMLFIVNGSQTRVPPNRVINLDGVPSGALRYEVVSPTWGPRASNTTTLASNETFRITAR